MILTTPQAALADCGAGEMPHEMDFLMRPSLVGGLFSIAAANAGAGKFIASFILRACLVFTIGATYPLVAGAQSPQSWSASDFSQTFPSQGAALAAIQSRGGRYALADHVELVSVAYDRVQYHYSATPRGPVVGPWEYSGNGVEPGPVSSEEQAAELTLANFKAKYPECGFKSIEVVEDWKSFQDVYGMPYILTRILKMDATSPNVCSRTFTVQHWKKRAIACPAQLGWNGKQCVTGILASVWTNPPPCDQCDLRGNPVNIVTGSKVQKEVDFDLGWLQFDRTFQSSLQTQGGLAGYWSHSLNMRLYTASTPGMAAVALPNGSVLRFSGFEAADGSGAFIRNDGEGYTLFREDGRYRFNANGRLNRIERYSGGALDIEFDSGQRISRVVHSTGRSVEFGYVDAYTYGESELAYIKDQDGLLVSYTFDDKTRLTKVTYRDGKSRRYLYEDANYNRLLTGIEDESGNRYATYTYNADGLAISSEHAGGTQKAGFEYRSDGSTVHTDALGAVERVTFTPADPYRKIASITTEAGTESWTYAPSTWTGADFRRRVNSHTHRSGRVDQFTYQDLADPALGDVRIKRETVASNRPEATTTEVWRRRDTNQVVKRVVGARTVTWLHNARGQVIQESTITGQGESRTKSYYYCDQIDALAGCPILGLLLSVDGPMPGSSDSTRYTYYAADAPGCDVGSSPCAYRKGDLWKVTDPVGHSVEYLGYDGAGRVTSQRDATVLVTSFEYHPRGWLTATRVHGVNGAPDRVTRIEYWPTGLTKQVTQPDGSYLSYRYDSAQRLVGIADAAGNSVEYVLDNAGNTIAENIRDVTGTLTHTLSRIYNARGELVTQADASSNPTDFAYDGNGNSTSVTDSLGRVTAHEYDPLNRLKRSVQDVGGIGAESRFKYDAQDNLTEVTDPKGLVTRYVRNGFGEVVTQTSPDTGVTAFTYDDAGNLATRTDARGVTAHYAYDALGRTTAVSYGDPAADTQYIYDQPSNVCAEGERAGAGRLASMLDPSGRTDYCYSAMGDLVRRVQTVEGQALTLRYAYDAFGRLQAMTYPDGSLVDYGYDALGQVSSVGVTPAGGVREVLLQSVQTLPFGPLQSWTFGNGRRLDRSYDLDYRPQTISDGRDGLNVAFGFDPVGNITSLTDHQQQGQTATLNYDALGRLTAFRDGGTGVPIEQYSYDATGNRLSFSNSAGVQPYVYPADSHRLASVDGVARTYDAMGNTLIIGSEWQYAYDAAGRLRAATGPETSPASYRHNGAGQRVLQQAGTERTLHLHGEIGEWLGEYESSGQSRQQVVWLGTRPIGLIQAGKVFYVESDHLGSPRMLIDPQRDVAVWRWSLLGESFGSGGAAEDPDQDGVDQLFELRFPGQRQDPSSGLTYNYFRDYEPRTGRYAQSDPIGLNGGFNTFLYAEGDALALIDPYGLQGFKPPPRFARPGGGNARQRAIHNSAQMRQISRNSHSTPIYSRGVSPEDVGSAENLASLVSGLDYTQYCAAALCRDNPMECSTRDEIITNWMPSNPTVAQVHARGCTCLQPYYIDQPPINEPKAEALDWLQGLKYIRKRR